MPDLQLRRGRLREAGQTLPLRRRYDLMGRFGVGSGAGLAVHRIRGHWSGWLRRIREHSFGRTFAVSVPSIGDGCGDDWRSKWARKPPP